MFPKDLINMSVVHCTIHFNQHNIICEYNSANQQTCGCAPILDHLFLHRKRDVFKWHLKRTDTISRLQSRTLEEVGVEHYVSPHVTISRDISSISKYG